MSILCFGIGCFVRYKAWEADAKLKSWTRAVGEVLGVQAVEVPAGRFGRKTEYTTHLRYETPAGPMMRPVRLSAPPGASPVPVYFDPAKPTSLPDPEARLLSVASPSNIRAAYAFLGAGASVLAITSIALHRRRAKNASQA